MNAPILNLTQHNATPEQIAQGVQATPLASVKALLNFDTLPSREQLTARAAQIAEIAASAANENGANAAMIGGAPFFMGFLECELSQLNIKPLYAFSQRESVETHAPDGTVQKTNVFKHIGFVEV